MSVVTNFAPVGRIRWKLREVMAARKITNEDLARALEKHPTSVSRLKMKDDLPAIGGEEIEGIRLQISALSRQEYGECLLTDLVLIEDDD